VLAAVALAGSNVPAAAQDVSFAGKAVNLTVGFEAGGGVDLYARIIGRHLANYLPGKPNIVVLNQPGAGGVVAMNSWSAKSEPDGLSISIAAQSQVDPEAIFRTSAKYEPAKFKHIGGVGGPSQALFISNDALKRLTDKSQPPVVMGIVGTTLRTGYYQALWGVTFLGWNVKWVPGYQQTGQIRQAMERGEIDMTAFGGTTDIQYMQKTGKFTVVSQSGQVEHGKRISRPILGNAPIFYNLVQGKIKDRAAQEAFDYSENVLQIGKWLILSPATPEPIVNTYVKAYEAMLKDPQFQNEVAKIDPDSPAVNKADLETLMRDLAKASPKTIEFITTEMKRQGL
jgi:tripartite-type tricarboxylate transporter receptor subunit TctC